FGMEERAYDDRNCIIIVSVHDSFVGLIVDTVAEVNNIEESNIDPSPSFKDESVSERYISGLGKIGDDVKILLNVERIISEKDLEKSTENNHGE
ncbi:MAG: chemotaxis protein CheW, partial [Deltaproteobacteria bacterium]|nr:chemotaxis protein CheW [Deltaproteobacteria bacterium]